MSTKKIRSITLGMIHQFSESKASSLVANIKVSYLYADGKRTNTAEFVVIECLTEHLGNIQLCIPFRDGLLEEIQKQLVFGQKITIADLGVLKDMKISIFQEALTFKFIIEEFLEV